MIAIQSPSFWIIANSISQFYTTHGVLPLPGSVPDMKAQSSDYITLQNVYKSKAREDLAEITTNVRSLERSLSRAVAIEEKEIEAFCKGAGYIKLVRGTDLRIARPDSKHVFGEQAQAAVNALTNPDSLAFHYFGFLAYDQFTASHALDGLGGAPMPPGLKDQQNDSEKMVGITLALIDEVIKESGTIVDEPEYSELKENASKVAKEIVRAGGAELHNVAALTGGLIAQEVIKVVTKQYVPVDNTCIFDAITSKSSVLRV
jgi:NEDD8-activating enzyme E1 regulatory subunit